MSLQSARWILQSLVQMLKAVPTRSVTDTQSDFGTESDAFPACGAGMVPGHLLHPVQPSMAGLLHEGGGDDEEEDDDADFAITVTAE